jgi:hypothetical protein
MSPNDIFAELSALLHVYERSLVVAHNTPTNYYLNLPQVASNKKSEFFAAVQIKKSYVAFHLMPVYCYPELLQSISPGLQAAMQGKSCFNFKRIDTELFDELKALVRQSFVMYQQLNKV